MDKSNLDLLGQFLHLDGLLRRYQIQHHREHGPMGTPRQGQGRILALLKLKAEISQKELSTILDIRSQSLGELLAKLERQGYVTRTPSTSDRRGMDIGLTEAGRAAADQDSEDDNLETFFDCLNDAEQKTLSEYLQRLIERLEQKMVSREARYNFSARSGFGDRNFRNSFRRDGREPRVDLRRPGDRNHLRKPFEDDESETSKNK